MLKKNFKACLISCDTDFSLLEWGKHLDKAILTLNLLQDSRENPQLSAHAYLFG